MHVSDIWREGNEHFLKMSFQRLIMAKELIVKSLFVTDDDMDNVLSVGVDATIPNHEIVLVCQGREEART